MIPNETGGRLIEGSALFTQDTTLTVDNPRDFVPGQVILIGEEQILVVSIEDGDLIVERGSNNTMPRIHPDLSPIFTLGGQATVFISTKEGEVKVLDDDGTGVPSLRWSYLPPERE